MKKSDQLESIIQKLVAAHDPEEIRGAYAEWAESYEQDLDFYGYLAPKLGVELFHQWVPDLSATILDAGCGTGLVGQILVETGYKTIDGCDFSAEMRQKAAQSGHYRTLQHADFFQPIPQYADSSYDGITCIGVYGSRFGDYFLRELVRIVRPNGIIVFTVRPHYFEPDVVPKLDQFTTKGLIKVESITHQTYMAGQNADAAYVVLRKL